MNALNTIEKKVVEMLDNGEHVHGLAREIALEMLFREIEKKEG